MKIYGIETNEVILKEIGDRIKMRRINLSITQRDLALESGVSLRTIINAESGGNISMKNIISILRVLRIVENLDLLIPESKTNPIEIFELGHRRRRVSKSSKKGDSNWKWGDEV